jgi:hypothetical protein
MSYLRKHWGPIAIGALVVVGGSYVGAQALQSGPQEVSLTQAKPEASAAPQAGHRMKGLRIGSRRLVHGEFVEQGKDGKLETVRVDHGVLQSVNETTLSIKEADGSTVDVPTTEQTRIVRDGQLAKIGDLKGGDNVFTLRMKQEDGSFQTMRVRAISPERAKELESKRGQRKQQQQTPAS